MSTHVHVLTPKLDQIFSSDKPITDILNATGFARSQMLDGAAIVKLNTCDKECKLRVGPIPV